MQMNRSHLGNVLLAAVAMLVCLTATSSALGQTLRIEGMVGTGSVYVNGRYLGQVGTFDSEEGRAAGVTGKVTIGIYRKPGNTGARYGIGPVLIVRGFDIRATGVSVLDVPKKIAAQLKRKSMSLVVVRGVHPATTVMKIAGRPTAQVVAFHRVKVKKAGTRFAVSFDADGHTSSSSSITLRPGEVRDLGAVDLQKVAPESPVIPLADEGLPPRKPGPGEVSATAEPTTGELIVIIAENGKLMVGSKTYQLPITAKKVVLEPGDHKLTVILDGRGPAHVTVAIKAGETTTLEDPAYGTLELLSITEGAAVFIDGHHIGNMPISPLKVGVGKHKVKATLDGYNDFSGVADVPAGKTLEFEIDQLQKSEGLLTYIEIKTNNPGATVLVDGENKGLTPLTAPILVKSGTRKVQVMLGDATAEETIDAVEGKTTPVTMTLIVNPVVKADGDDDTSIAEKWWFWTAIGTAVAVGAGLGIAAATGAFEGGESGGCPANHVPGLAGGCTPVWATNVGN